jgi:hypothetical protein
VTQEETPAKRQRTRIEKKRTTYDEGQHTFKRLNKQLREAQDMIIQLREDNRRTKMQCVELLDDCEPAIDNAIFMVRRNQPLHKKLKNIYQQNLTLRKENITLKQNLQKLETDKRGKGKLDFLVEAT